TWSYPKSVTTFRLKPDPFFFSDSELITTSGCAVEQTLVPSTTYATWLTQIYLATTAMRYHSRRKTHLLWKTARKKAS
ncbi:hypothetical protein M378DRAFT_164031, partial [Amanita muscaria Koide BX008]